MWTMHKARSISPSIGRGEYLRLVWLDDYIEGGVVFHRRLISQLFVNATLITAEYEIEYIVNSVVKRMFQSVELLWTMFQWSMQ